MLHDVVLPEKLCACIPAELRAMHLVNRSAGEVIERERSVDVVDVLYEAEELLQIIE